MSHNNSAHTHSGEQSTAGLRALLDQHLEKRVLVLGTTCTGKSTMLQSIPGARDQDVEVFAKLTPEQAAYVCQQPWTEEIGKVMTQFVQMHVESAVGRPVFGTVLIDCDLVVLLNISDTLLQQRTAQREVPFADAQGMQCQIRQQVALSGIPCVTYWVG